MNNKWAYDPVLNIITSPDGTQYRRGDFIIVPDTPNGKIQVKDNLIKITDTKLLPYRWEAVSWNEMIVFLLNKLGLPGEPGKEISEIVVTSENLGTETQINFLFKFNDGSESSLKSVKVPNGKDGTPGEKGAQLQSIEILKPSNNSILLHETLTDGSTVDSNAVEIPTLEAQWAEGGLETENPFLIPNNPLIKELRKVERIQTPFNIVKDTDNQVLIHTDYNTLQIYETATNKSYLMSRDKLVLSNVTDDSLRLEFDPATGTLKYYNNGMDEIATKKDNLWKKSGENTIVPADSLYGVNLTVLNIDSTSGASRLTISNSLGGAINGLATSQITFPASATNKEYVDSKFTNLINFLKQAMPDHAEELDEL